MSTAYSLSALTEELPSEKMSSSTRQIDKEGTLTLVGEELLCDPNRDFANQTQVEHLEDNRGDSHRSSTVDARPGQLLLFPPPLRAPQEHFNVLQKWEGYVVEVRQDTFLARLTPIVGNGPDQEAEIYLEEIAEEDRALIEPGAIFRWSIGYLDRPSGRLRASTIRFRRLPAWTRRELETAHVEAAKLRELLDDGYATRATSIG